MPTITLDEQGYPLLLGTTEVATKSGNPYHNTFTGEFSFSPNGVVVLSGANLLKLLSAGTRKVLADRAALGKANQLAAAFIDGKIHIVLLRDGKRIHSFAVSPSQEKGKAQNEKDGKGQSGIAITPLLKDSIIGAARQLDLTDAQLIKFIEDKTGAKIGPEQQQEFIDLVNEQRIEDTIHYLHYQLQQKVEGAPKDDTQVVLGVGRGYFRKVFSRYNEAETQIILQRLQGLGWSQDILQANVVTKFPQRLKKVFAIEHKKEEGKATIEKANAAREGKTVRKRPI